MTRTVQLLRHDAYNSTITSAWPVQLYYCGPNQGCWWPIRFENFDVVIIIISLFTFILTENLALRKTAAQSSRHNVSSGAENAVDGNRNPLFDANGNCALTDEDDPSWWRVDLGTNRVPVSDVFIVNRLFPTSAQETNGDYEITLGEK